MGIEVMRERVSRKISSDPIYYRIGIYGTAILLVALFIVFLVTIPQDDVLNFYRQAMDMMAGKLPYAPVESDAGFVFEFPPFALALFLFPGLFTDDLDVYRWSFDIFEMVFQILALWVLLKIVPSDSKSRVTVAVVYLAVTLIYLLQSVNKFDGFVMAFTVFSLYFFKKEKWWAAYALMTVAALTKMYPLILIPLMLAYNLIRGRGSIDAMKQAVVSIVIVTAVAFVPLILAGVSFGDSLSFLGFHEDRGFQVESVMATITILFGFVGLSNYHLVPLHYTYDVSSPLLDILSDKWILMTGLVVLAVIVFTAHHMFRARDSDSKMFSLLVLGMMVTIAAFMLTNKVFSTQYVMWLYPFMALFCCMLPSSRKKNVLIVTSLVMVLCCMIFLNCEFMSPAFAWFCMIRDVLIVVICAFALLEMRSITGGTSQANLE